MCKGAGGRALRIPGSSRDSSFSSSIRQGPSIRVGNTRSETMSTLANRSVARVIYGAPVLTLTTVNMPVFVAMSMQHESSHPRRQISTLLRAASSSSGAYRPNCRCRLLWRCQRPIAQPSTARRCWLRLSWPWAARSCAAVTGGGTRRVEYAAAANDDDDALIIGAKPSCL